MPKQINLPFRLKAVAGMVTKGNSILDVGSDHGLLGIYLVQKGISPLVLDMDIRMGPLLGARRYVEEYAMNDRIKLRLSDGVTEYEPGELGEKVSLICAGMGGYLIRNILRHDSKKTLSFKESILAPQSDVSMLRHFIRESGYLIVDEDMVFEKGIFYPLMKIVPNESHKQLIPSRDMDADIVDMLGPILLKNHHPVLKFYLERCISQNKKIIIEIEKNTKGASAIRKQKSLGLQLKKLEKIYSDWG